MDARGHDFVAFKTCIGQYGRTRRQTLGISTQRNIGKTWRIVNFVTMLKRTFFTFAAASFTKVSAGRFGFIARRSGSRSCIAFAAACTFRGRAFCRISCVQIRAIIAAAITFRPIIAILWANSCSCGCYALAAAAFVAISFVDTSHFTND